MSFSGMLKHRMSILRLVETTVSGYSVTTWEIMSENKPCWVDLNFIRQGKDAMWTPEAGRPADRSGVLFCMPKVDIRSGDRIQVTRGPKGTFEIEGAIDEAWRPTNQHHIEVGILEVAQQLTGKMSDE